MPDKERFAPLYLDYQIPKGKKTYLIGFAIDDVLGVENGKPVRSKTQKESARLFEATVRSLGDGSETYSRILLDKEATKRNFVNLIEQTINAAEGADIVILNASHGKKGRVALESEKAPLTFGFLRPIVDRFGREAVSALSPYIAPTDEFHYDRYRRLLSRHKGRVAIVNGACEGAPNKNEIPDNGIWVFAGRRDEVSTNSEIPYTKGSCLGNTKYNQLIAGVAGQLIWSRVPLHGEKYVEPDSTGGKLLDAIRKVGSRALFAYGSLKRALGKKSPSPIDAIEKAGKMFEGMSLEIEVGKDQYTHHPGIAYGRDFGK